jgi:hypothetical protein
MNSAVADPGSISGGAPSAAHRGSAPQHAAPCTATGHDLRLAHLVLLATSTATARVYAHYPHHVEMVQGLSRDGRKYTTTTTSASTQGGGDKGRLQ